MNNGIKLDPEKRSQAKLRIGSMALLNEGSASLAGTITDDKGNSSPVTLIVDKESWERVKGNVVFWNAKTEAAKHALVDGTLVKEDGGIVGKCICGWTTSPRISMMAASGAFQDHLEQHGATKK